ncbi:MAG: Dam family site-specific DNA-(adenine-N6)-methyltransferase, partial [Thermodesulfobacteriota bacterium]|nr:Dam family site-specific DNA-(adenine-N6)-methyltransferase [Thermodesulfobacteriota bacterium]
MKQLNLTIIKKPLSSTARPILKWAGGKQQLLPVLLSKVPKHYGNYIEPFLGGGALFFALKPQNAIISDTNPELINLYQTLVENVEGLITLLCSFKYDRDTFYEVRAQDFTTLSPVDAAARTIYLNRTCFNGLFRVNRKGQFNVPFGKYKNPRICEPDRLRTASEVLKEAKIICEDYIEILRKNAKPGDIIYLDPPYLPISDYSDFKRYTMEQFYEEDHVELADEVRRLHDLGCFVLLTNSNHPLVYKLYNGFEIEVVQTRRNINRDGHKRTGEDVIITIPPRQHFALRPAPSSLSAQVKKYPSTRFMGSKQALLPHIWNVTSQFKFDSVLDLFSGSGIVGYMFKSQGKQVFTNDYMVMCATFALALIENCTEKLDEGDVQILLDPLVQTDNFVNETFQGIYFTDKENILIDRIRANIKRLDNRIKRSLAMTALIRACLKKRPRGIFTYTGFRYDDGRRDLRMSLENHFKSAVKIVNRAVFDNGKKNHARFGDAMTVGWRPDLVYIDPPYYSALSDNEYVRRYHFVEGLARDWIGVDIQWHTKTRKFKSYPTPFSSRT